MEITTLAHQSWNAYQKIAFRFFCCLFLIYLFPFPIDSLPFVNELLSIHPKLSEWFGAPFEKYTEFWHAVIPWVGKNIIRLTTPITIFTNGSGDTTYDYVLLLTYFILSFVGCMIWTVIDRRRPSYTQAYYWLRVLVRYYLGAVMFGYGFAKVFHLQMPFPYLSQLVQSFGDKSPMGLAWSFIGYSKVYSAYTGWAEVLGGLLLLFRRTVLPGALVVFIVTLNIAMINYCYDVPVKLYSSLLLIMAVFLMAPDFNRLLNVFWRNSAVQSVSFPPMLHSRKKKIAGAVLKWLFIISLFYSNINGGLSSRKQYGDLRPLPPLYGIYNTEIVVRNHDTIPPLTTDSTRWKQLIIQFKENAQVKLMNDSLKFFKFIVNDSARSILFYSVADSLNKSSLLYQADSTSLVLSGQIKADSIYIRLRKFDVNKFRLVSRGYHWINEYPYNR